MLDREYNLVGNDKYKQCSIKAYLLLKRVAEYYDLNIPQVNYKHIISYIKQNFDVFFVFYDKQPFENIGILLSSTKIKFPNLLPNATFKFLDSVIVDNVAGTTIKIEDKYVLFVNQNAPKSRVVFSTLHEIVHLYFHSHIEQVRNAFASLNTNTLFYEEDAIEYEDEANVIASILFLPDERLYDLIKIQKLTFEEICLKEGISKPALHNRIKNHLIYNCFCIPNYATTIVLQFRDGNNKTLLEVID